MCESQPQFRKPTMEEDADFLHRSYEIGYVTKRDIERWAEIQIAAVDQPSIDLIELALIRQKDSFDILHLLNDLRGGKPHDFSVDMQIGLIALCFLDGEHSIRKSIKALLELNYANPTSSDQQQEIYLLDHECDYAHGSLDAVANHLRAFLTPYAQKLHHEYAHIMALHQS